MRVFVMINHFNQLRVTQTTFALMHAAARSGYEVCVFGVHDLSLAPDGSIWATARSLRGAVPSERRAAMELLQQGRLKRLPLAAPDVLLIRTNPGRDTQAINVHHMALELCVAAERRGLLVSARPAALLETFGKLSLDLVPAAYRPPMLISADADAIVRFVREQENATVLKPMWGSRGSNVFSIRPNDDNLREIAASLVRAGFVVAQPRLPEAEEGCARVITLFGEVFSIEGHDAAFNRVPPDGEFRSNVHAGARTKMFALSAAQREACNAAALALLRRGIAMIGVDLVGAKIIECNIFSPGGLNIPRRYYGHDYATPAIERLLAGVGAQTELRSAS